MSISIYINMCYVLLTLIGYDFGRRLRLDHLTSPLNPIALLIWAFVAILGLIFTKMTAVFYLMTMVTIGWIGSSFLYGYSYI